MRFPLISALLAATLACAATVLPVTAGAQEKTVVSAAFKSVFYLPAYIAEERGYFKKEGLDVRIDIAGSATIALAAVISGSADFSLHGPEWTAISAMRGGKVQVIGSTLNGLGVWLICKPDVKFDGFKSLKGRTVVMGAMPTTSSSVFLDLLSKDGVDPKTDLKLVEVPLGNEIGPLAAGQADCGIMYEPGASQAESKGFKTVLAFPQKMGPYTFSAISTRTDIDPAKAKHFLTAIDMALKDMHKNPDAAVATGLKIFPAMDPAVVRAAVLRLINDKVIAPSVAIDPQAMTAALQTQVNLKNLPSMPSDASFLNAAWANDIAKNRY